MDSKQRTHAGTREKRPATRWTRGQRTGTSALILPMRSLLSLPFAVALLAAPFDRSARGRARSLPAAQLPINTQPLSTTTKTTSPSLSIPTRLRKRPPSFGLTTVPPTSSPSASSSPTRAIRLSPSITRASTSSPPQVTRSPPPNRAMPTRAGPSCHPRNKIPIGPIKIGGKGKNQDKKIEQDFSEFQYNAIAVEAHTTRAGFLCSEFQDRRAHWPAHSSSFAASRAPTAASFSPLRYRSTNIWRAR